MERQTSVRRRRIADQMAITGFIVSLWGPVAVLIDAPLAAAAVSGGIALSTGAGRVDARNHRATAAFLAVLAVGAGTLILHWSTS